MIAAILLIALIGDGNAATPPCPVGMVYLPLSKVCIDMYEASTVDTTSQESSSPNYNPNASEAAWQWNRFVNMTVPGYPMPLRGAEYTRALTFLPMAQSIFNSTPQSYVDRPNAETACGNAGKRLCFLSEWKEACRGPRNTTFPYGDSYTAGRCNVGVPYWPPALLNRSNNWEMLDPRIAPLTYPRTSIPFRTRAGAHTQCTNGYGAFDMVGNNAEIVADIPRESYMTFAGGFYARDSTTPQVVSCEWAVTAHAEWYNDYSIGFRCCASLP